MYKIYMYIKVKLLVTKKGVPHSCPNRGNQCSISAEKYLYDRALSYNYFYKTLAVKPFSFIFLNKMLFSDQQCRFNRGNEVKIALNRFLENYVLSRGAQRV